MHRFTYTPVQGFPQVCKFNSMADMYLMQYLLTQDCVPTRCLPVTLHSPIGVQNLPFLHLHLSLLESFAVHSCPQ